MRSSPPIPNPGYRATRGGVLASLAVVALLAAAATGCAVPPTEPEPFDVVEATIPEMRAAMESGRVTSRQLVMEHLARIARYEWKLNAAVSINPNALAEAEALDAERAAGRVRGPLHGIPVALKDNIHTTHLPTTGGALAFEGYHPPYEATLTTKLREAGAIIIAKAGLTEFANFMAGPPNQMPGNYNALTGYGLNPYDPRRDPRDGRDDGRPALTTGGSSSGIGTAASFWAANVGTDTGGSIISPSNANMLVGIRPTLARISRWGVAPVTLDHDMAGPMTRTVTDAAIMLGALEGDDPDPNDPATGRCEAPPERDYTPFLNREGLRGARIGIPRAFYYEPVTDGGGGRRGPGRDSELRRPRPGGQLQYLAALHRGASGEGLGRGMLRQLQVRDEARFQHVVGVARANGAGDDAHRAARMESRPPRRGLDEVRTVALRHFR